MTRFSANLGFLWTDRSLPDAVRAAADAGFVAVELHWPYTTDPRDLAAALNETGLPCLSLNTVRGDVAAGEFGMAVLPDRADEARDSVTRALDYAAAIDARFVQVMAGKIDDPDALARFADVLSFACEAAAQAGREVLIEPLNRHDAPGYALSTIGQAMDVIAAVGHPALRLNFDIYHVARTEGDLITRFAAVQDKIGHVQFAAVPDRGVPDHGEVDLPWVFQQLETLGYDAPLGAEYKPGDQPTGDTLGWLAPYL